MCGAGARPGREGRATCATRGRAAPYPTRAGCEITGRPGAEASRAPPSGAASRDGGRVAGRLHPRRRRAAEAPHEHEQAEQGPHAMWGRAEDVADLEKAAKEQQLHQHGAAAEHGRPREQRGRQHPVRAHAPYHLSQGPERRFPDGPREIRRQLGQLARPQPIRPPRAVATTPILERGRERLRAGRAGSRSVALIRRHRPVGAGISRSISASLPASCVRFTSVRSTRSASWPRRSPRERTTEATIRVAASSVASPRQPGSAAPSAARRSRLAGGNPKLRQTFTEAVEKFVRAAHSAPRVRRHRMNVHVESRRADRPCEASVVLSPDP